MNLKVGASKGPNESSKLSEMMISGFGQNFPVSMTQSFHLALETRISEIDQPPLLF